MLKESNDLRCIKDITLYDNTEVSVYSCKTNSVKAHLSEQGTLKRSQLLAKRGKNAIDVYRMHCLTIHGRDVWVVEVPYNATESYLYAFNIRPDVAMLTEATLHNELL